MFRSMSKLDAVDLDLLRALAADPRATVVALAEKLGLSTESFWREMKRGIVYSVVEYGKTRMQGECG